MNSMTNGTSARRPRSPRKPAAGWPVVASPLVCPTWCTTHRRYDAASGVHRNRVGAARCFPNGHVSPSTVVVGTRQYEDASVREPRRVVVQPPGAEPFELTAGQATALARLLVEAANDLPDVRRG